MGLLVNLLFSDSKSQFRNSDSDGKNRPTQVSKRIRTSRWHFSQEHYHRDSRRSNWKRILWFEQNRRLSNRTIGELWHDDEAFLPVTKEIWPVFILRKSINLERGGFLEAMRFGNGTEKHVNFGTSLISRSQFNLPLVPSLYETRTLFSFDLVFSWFLWLCAALAALSIFLTINLSINTPFIFNYTQTKLLHYY